MHMRYLVVMWNERIGSCEMAQGTCISARNTENKALWDQTKKSWILFYFSFISKWDAINELQMYDEIVTLKYYIIH